MRRRKNSALIEIKIYQGIILMIVALVVAGGILYYAQAKNANQYPRLANYILGTLPTDNDSVVRLAKNDLLVVSPEQGIVRRSVIDTIKKINPDIIILAYVPAPTYNTSAWNSYPANTLYKNFHVPDSCWLRDSGGQPISNWWPGLKHINLSSECSDNLVNFVRDNILSQGIYDGVFFDMIFDNISWLNNGDIDLNGDKVRDNKSWADSEWQKRTVYLLQKARSLSVKYVLMNGSSVASFQEYTNGRMYENFPTPWEAGGSWSGVMSGLVRNAAKNQSPKIYIVNANTNNTGNQNNFRSMRFGLGSALMLDNVYFSFDFGDKDHNQTWWYDEYDVSLGTPSGPARSMNNRAQFSDDVWRRDYAHGIALVNPTGQTQNIDLGGEFEKINGVQDRTVNNGLVVDNVNISSKDALILLKTFQTVDNAVFVNGAFLRFYNYKGARARNGFFAFDETVAGGSTVWRGDLNADNRLERVVMTSYKMQIFNQDGNFWYNDYPLGWKVKGGTRFAMGRFKDKANNILVSSIIGGKVALLNQYGLAINDAFYPLGKKYAGGFSVAVGDVDGDKQGENIIGVGIGKPAEVIIYDQNLKKIKKRFYPYEKNFIGGVEVATGDVNGDGKTEIITLPMKNKKPLVRVFNGAGKKIAEFLVGSGFGGANFTIGAADVNFDGRDEIVIGGN
ncbi:MAG: hypothetical protein A2261_01345 [Candidatus Magasanikbacteria bacterium RIFOXYA2_FULL_44_8]|uniref:Uncharacterized protein n=1 Tax=Candidatus Magasanikbacteria bacterium RIFOXYA2_FULL_44_8 TaxID=1798696 RepID=A0A1F6NLV0_9BACT|nr:MAG: hypothetical protein A2261_01345 [Candidatus Magasanikbacteria bacterium RIFOXYA2_FULL_44_8]